MENVSAQAAGLKALLLGCGLPPHSAVVRLATERNASALVLWSAFRRCELNKDELVACLSSLLSQISTSHAASAPEHGGQQAASVGTIDVHTMGAWGEGGVPAKQSWFNFWVANSTTFPSSRLRACMWGPHRRRTFGAAHKRNHAAARSSGAA